MYGNQCGEFVCRFWGLRVQVWDSRWIWFWNLEPLSFSDLWFFPGTSRKQKERPDKNDITTDYLWYTSLVWELIFVVIKLLSRNLLARDTFLPQERGAFADFALGDGKNGCRKFALNLTLLKASGPRLIQGFSLKEGMHLCLHIRKKTKKSKFYVKIEMKGWPRALG